jgi:hypothetical protein
VPHRERIPYESEAAIVRQIFRLSAAGVGQVRITRLLNSGRAIAPRAQLGRPNGWAPSSVHEVLFRELYRGVITWNRSRKRNKWGQHQYERDTRGQRRPRLGRDSKYLLPGFGRCALCRAGLHVRTRSHGRRRAFFYACLGHYTRGPAVCPHVQQWPMEGLDREVLAASPGRSSRRSPATSSSRTSSRM